jgi:hypothetical protein
VEGYFPNFRHLIFSLNNNTEPFSKYVDLKHNSQLRSLSIGFDMQMSLTAGETGQDILQLLSQIVSMDMEEVIFSNVTRISLGLGAAWLGVANALERPQFVNLKRVRICLAKINWMEASKASIRNDMAQCDARGILELE